MIRKAAFFVFAVLCLIAVGNKPAFAQSYGQGSQQAYGIPNIDYESAKKACETQLYADYENCRISHTWWGGNWNPISWPSSIVFSYQLCNLAAFSTHVSCMQSVPRN